jgi:uncharacterized RDD family membrane protein YckC
MKPLKKGGVSNGGGRMNTELWEFKLLYSVFFAVILALIVVLLVHLSGRIFPPIIIASIIYIGFIFFTWRERGGCGSGY